MQTGLIRYLTLYLILSVVLGAEPRNYYYGEGIGFLLPDNWILVENYDSKGLNSLQEFGITLEPDQIGRLKDHRSVYFILPFSEGATLVSMDVLYGSVTYSKLLMDTFVNLSHKHLEKKGYLFQRTEFTTTVNIGGVVSPTLAIETSFLGRRFDYLATLIPASDRIVVVHSFVMPQNREALTRDLKRVFETFSGASAGKEELNQSLFTLQIILVIFALVFLYFRKKQG
jgi:hypothetical protein